ncbi:MAG: hypothetical protein M3Q48_17750 [Actinomycetota bacterium]|nr:hypothetical protein [Actinomycetota bacterium]
MLGSVGLRAGHGPASPGHGPTPKAAAGGYAYGAPPFGYQAERGEVVPRMDEDAALALIAELH